MSQAFGFEDAFVRRARRPCPGVPSTTRGNVLSSGRYHLATLTRYSRSSGNMLLVCCKTFTIFVRTSVGASESTTVYCSGDVKAPTSNRQRTTEIGTLIRQVIVYFPWSAEKKRLFLFFCLFSAILLAFFALFIINR